MEKKMDKVVHFEIPVENLERAKEFYSNVFEWQINFMPEFNYTSVITSLIDEKRMPKEPGAINGGMLKKPDFMKGPVITVNVKNIDESLSKIKHAKGKIIKDKFSIGGMGYAAYFIDTEGNILGLWQDIKK